MLQDVGGSYGNRIRKDDDIEWKFGVLVGEGKNKKI